MLQRLRGSCAALEISDADNENQGVNDSSHSKATANASLEGNGELHYYKTRAIYDDIKCVY